MLRQESIQTLGRRRCAERTCGDNQRFLDRKGPAVWHALMLHDEVCFVFVSLSSAQTSLVTFDTLDALDFGWTEQNGEWRGPETPALPALRSRQGRGARRKLRQARVVGLLWQS